MNTLRQSVAAVRRSKWVWLLQFLLNPALFALAVWWITIPEAHRWQLALSGLLALAIVVTALWLHAGTLVHFVYVHAEEENVRTTFRAVWHTLAAFAVWAVAMAACLYYVDHWGGNRLQSAAYLRSVLPLGLRQNLSSTQVDLAAGFLFWFLFWIVVPGLFLPFGLQMAKSGFSGLGRDGWSAWGHTVRRLAYWTIIFAAAIVGVYLPEKILGWHPQLPTLRLETASLILRGLIAWFLTTTAWVVLTSAVGRFSVEKDQPMLPLPIEDVPIDDVEEPEEPSPQE
jgi:hypothetical protein